MEFIHPGPPSPDDLHELYEEGPTTTDTPTFSQVVKDIVKPEKRPTYKRITKAIAVPHEELGFISTSLTQVNAVIERYPTAVPPSSQNFDRHIEDGKKSLLFFLTSHLQPKRLALRLDPVFWCPIYLRALNITVRTGVECNPDWTTVIHEHKVAKRTSILPAKANIRAKYFPDMRLYNKLLNTLSKGYKVELPSEDDDGLLLPISELCKTNFKLNSDGASLLYMITNYLILYVTHDLSKKAWITVSTDLTKPRIFVELKYRAHSVVLSPRICLCSKPPPGYRSVPMLAILRWEHRSPHYAREIAYLIAFAQHYFGNDGGSGEETYQPYLIALRRTTRVSIVTAVISREYLNSIERRDPRELEVIVSEEFDLAFRRERVRFLEVYSELVMGVIARDERAGRNGGEEKRADNKKRKRAFDEGEEESQVKRQKEEMVVEVAEEEKEKEVVEKDQLTMENMRLMEEIEAEVDLYL